MNNPSKYPKTFHLPWSPGKNQKQIETLENFIGKRIIITEKMDGANCLLNINGVYSRSCQGFAYGDQWDYIKNLYPGIQQILTNYGRDDIDIFGENLFAKHSIQYNNLPEYFMVFAVRKEFENFGIKFHVWEPWDDVKEFADLIEMPYVPIWFDGVVNSENELIELTNKIGNEPSFYGEKEGIVVRNASSFKDQNFQYNVAKWVRAGHVKGQHWTKNIPAENVLRKNRQPCRICGTTENLTLVRGKGFFCEEHIDE